MSGSRASVGERVGKSRLLGQTTAEYAVLAAMTVFAIFGAVDLVRRTVIHFYYDVVSLICLPIP